MSDSLPAADHSETPVRAPLWVDVNHRVPLDRRLVYVYGVRIYPPVMGQAKPKPLGVDKWNGTSWESERYSGPFRPAYRVTHWAHIVGPHATESSPPDEVETADYDQRPPHPVDRRQVSSLGRLELKPDDVVVVTVKERVSDEAAQRIRDWWEKFFPGHRALVVDAGTQIGSIGTADPLEPTLGETITSAMLVALRRDREENRKQHP